jgi:type VI secretion system secreted protein VgrG
LLTGSRRGSSASGRSAAPHFYLQLTIGFPRQRSKIEDGEEKHCQIVSPVNGNMATYTQTNRPLQVSTPLGENVLLVTGFRGHEELSALFSFELSLIAENSTTIDFSQLVGNSIGLRVATLGKDDATEWRYINGICARFSQGNRNEEFTTYYAEVVPQVWLLTRRFQSRIFQQKSIPDILKQVLQGFDCDYQLRGQYEPREYCVQYRETDFDFASRLMEEEGIFYFFKHTDSGHKMIIADSAVAHIDVPGLPQARYDVVEGGPSQGDHVFEWRKTQALRSAKYSLWDHTFQQPTQNLEAKESLMASVQAGTVTHKLTAQASEQLEIYDYPGGYAVRFDGINPSGGEQPERLQKILDDNKRTVKLRMEAEAVQSLTVHGSSGCRNFVAGHKFSLDRHFDADGDYVLTAVTHDASMVNPYRAGSNSADLQYSNIFTCIPFQLPFRPPRRTPKPFVQGVQNALVTGPPGEEIFPDKYGRVKVQFYWDRQGKKDANSSCWLRVGTMWAGKGWGSLNIPRIGQEVIVAFVEGNPDEPVIISSVYNRETMPANSLPDKKVICGLKSNTHKGKGYNEMSMDDTAGKENITIHAQYDMNTTIEHDENHTVKTGNRTIQVQTGKHTETIKGDTKITIQTGTYGHEVSTGTADYKVKGALTEYCDTTQATTVKGNITIMSTTADIVLNGATQIQLITGSSSILMKSDGTIKISGTEITISGTAKVQMGVGNQTVTSDTAQVAVAGAAIASAATGKHEITGAVVKIN